MNKFKFSILFILYILTSVTSAFADHYPIDKRIDIRNYQFNITFSDKSNEINATAFVTVYFNQSGVKQFRLDLTNKAMNGKGMEIGRAHV